MWGLEPQPVKKEFKTEVDIYVSNGLWENIKVKHFDTFIKGVHITWHQWIFFLAVERALIGQSPKKISVVSGHGTGKDASLAMLMPWYLFCHYNAQIGATAPTSDQIHSVLWKELKIWMDRMPPEIMNLYEWQSEHIRIKESRETWFARARTASKENPEAIAGLHGDHVMIVVDEASGVDNAIYQSAEGSLTGFNTLVILIGNGIRNTGYFYDTHNSDKENWQTLQFDSEESPLVGSDYIDRMLSKYGRESDEFSIRVSGKFPASEQMDDQGWIPLLVENQVRQLQEGIPLVGRMLMGIDPAGEGDDTTRFIIRDNFQAKVVASMTHATSKEVAKQTYDLIKEYDLKPQDVIVDNFGIGANVSAELLLLDHLLAIQAVNWGEKAQDEDVYLNRRAECCFRARDWLIRGAQVVGDELKRDITGFWYKNTLSGKKQIMDKPKLKLRLGRSPDRGDAFFLTFYDDLDLKKPEAINPDIYKDTKTDIYSAI